MTKTRRNRRVVLPGLRPRRRRRLARRPLPPVSVIPTLVTLGNLVCGLFAIHFATLPLDTVGPLGLTTLTVAGTLVFLGMFFDAIDGSIARLTDSTSELGAQLDSLSDLVTFGLAPAIMMVRLVAAAFETTLENPILLGPQTGDMYARVVWAVAVAYVCCTALRLARFNAETPSETAADHIVFRGLPSPGAGGALASLIVLHQHLLGTDFAAFDDATMTLARLTAFLMPALALACAIAMVSSVPYVHVVNRYVSGPRSFGYAARMAVLIVVATLWFQETLAVAFTVYALSGPVRLWTRRIRRRLTVRSRLRRAARDRSEQESAA